MMTAQKPKTRKRAIYLVTDFGGDWEDAWERPVIAFTDKARAEECAAKRETRQYDEYGPIWDYEGSEVKKSRSWISETGRRRQADTRKARALGCDTSAIMVGSRDARAVPFLAPGFAHARGRRFFRAVCRP